LLYAKTTSNDSVVSGFVVTARPVSTAGRYDAVVPTLTASDVIAIVAIVAGVTGTLVAGFLADRRAAGRAKTDRVMQARLRAIEDTQRYVLAMMEHISTSALVPAKAGLPPNLGDYPKVALSLIGEAETVMAFVNLVVDEGKRIKAGGPPWTDADRDRYENVGIVVSRALSAQEERVLAGKPPVIEPADRQDADAAAAVERLKS
jgi:hypothetical protein